MRENVTKFRIFFFEVTFQKTSLLPCNLDVTPFVPWRNKRLGPRFFLIVTLGRYSMHQRAQLRVQYAGDRKLDYFSHSCVSVCPPTPTFVSMHRLIMPDVTVCEWEKSRWRDGRGSARQSDGSTRSRSRLVTWLMQTKLPQHDTRDITFTIQRTITCHGYLYTVFLYTRTITNVK